MPPQKTGDETLRDTVQRMIDAGYPEEKIVAYVNQVDQPTADPQAASRATRAMEINTSLTPGRRTVALSPENEAQYGPSIRRFEAQQAEESKPSSVLKGLATLLPGGLPAQMLYQATAGAIGRNFEGGPPPSNSEAVVNALGDAAVPGGMAALEGGLKYAAGPLKDAGLKLIKSAWKINKPAAKMSDASMGGSRVNQATDKMITDVAEEGLGAPSKRNENTLLDRLTQAGKKVETDWVEPAERPIGITRADRLLPSQASGTETTTLHTPDAAPFEGAVPAASIPNPLGAQYPFNLAPESAAAGSHPPQHLGEGARVTATGGNDSPGVLLRETGPRVEGGQPFDTVAKADILAGLDADIAAAKHAMAPTTGLEALRARWEQAPDFIPRDQAREIVKSINMRNAPRYHNALNDPVAVAAEKGVGRTITGQMKTDEMAKANARYQLLKPMSVAMSDAARRAGNRDVIGLKGAMTANAMATAGATRYGLPGFIGGGALGLGMSAMTHPVAKGTVGQGMYDIGKALPGINSKLITPEMTRQLILQLLLQGK